VNPALAFQYVSDSPPEGVADGSVRVPAYYNNLNSWLGQTVQRDCPQVKQQFLALRDSFCVFSQSLCCLITFDAPTAENNTTV